MTLPLDYARCDGKECQDRERCARFVAYCDGEGDKVWPCIHSQAEGCELFLRAEDYYEEEERGDVR